MLNFSTILSEAAADTAAAGSAANDPFGDNGTIIFCTLGICILIGWLFRFDGFAALKKAPVRRCHWVFAIFSVGILMLWLVLMSVVVSLVSVTLATASAEVREAATYVVMAIMQIGLIGLILLTARAFLVRGLKGFGLRLGTVDRDAGWAAVHLCAVYPLIIAGLAVTLFAGRLFHPEFSLEVHESLGLLSEAGLTMRILVVIFAALIVPVFEELLFRGMFQTSLRCFTGSPWTAILLTSIFFSILHPPTHIPALFMLSCGLGYAYERSGSLLRPILMHMLFNGLSIAMTLIASN